VSGAAIKRLFSTDNQTRNNLRHLARSKPGQVHNSNRKQISHNYDEEEDKGNLSAWQHFLAGARLGHASPVNFAGITELRRRRG